MIPDRAEYETIRGPRCKRVRGRRKRASVEYIIKAMKGLRTGAGTGRRRRTDGHHFDTLASVLGESPGVIAKAWAQRPPRTMRHLMGFVSLEIERIHGKGAPRRKSL